MPRMRALAIVLSLVFLFVVIPGAWPAAGTLTQFNCDYASGVNGSLSGVPQIVGWNLGGKSGYGWWGLSVNNPTVGCGSQFTISGATTTEIIGVSSANTIVGFSQNKTGWQGFVWCCPGTSAGVPATFSVNGSLYTRAAGVNSAGVDGSGNSVAWVVGQYGSSGTQHGFAIEYNITANPPSKETLVTFDVAGATDTMPTGINDAGAIVGKYTDAAGNTHGFILDGIPTTSGPVAPKTMNCAGARSTAINGISNPNLTNPYTTAAIIVGSAAVTNRVEYAFYAPEPASSNLSWPCTQLPVTTRSGNPRVTGIDSKGQYMVGFGGALGNFLYQLF